MIGPEPAADLWSHLAALDREERGQDDDRERQDDRFER